MRSRIRTTPTSLRCTASTPVWAAQRRRALQEKYNKEHGVVPATVVRAVRNINAAAGTTDYIDVPKVPKNGKAGKGGAVREVDVAEQMRALRAEMFSAAENLDFERAAKI